MKEPGGQRMRAKTSVAHVRGAFVYGFNGSNSLAVPVVCVV